MNITNSDGFIVGHYNKKLNQIDLVNDKMPIRMLYKIALVLKNSTVHYVKNGKDYFIPMSEILDKGFVQNNEIIYGVSNSMSNNVDLTK